MATNIAGTTGDEYSCHFVKLAVRLLGHEVYPLRSQFPRATGWVRFAKLQLYVVLRFATASS